MPPLLLFVVIRGKAYIFTSRIRPRVPGQHNSLPVSIHEAMLIPQLTTGSAHRSCTPMHGERHLVSVLTGFGQLVGPGNVRGARDISGNNSSTA